MSKLNIFYEFETQTISFVIRIFNQTKVKIRNANVFLLGVWQQWIFFVNGSLVNPRPSYQCRFTAVSVRSWVRKHILSPYYGREISSNIFSSSLTWTCVIISCFPNQFTARTWLILNPIAQLFSFSIPFQFIEFLFIVVVVNSTAQTFSLHFQ